MEPAWSSVVGDAVHGVEYWISFLAPLMILVLSEVKVMCCMLWCSSVGRIFTSGWESA